MNIFKKILSIVIVVCIIMPLFFSGTNPVIPKLPAETKTRRSGSVQGVIIHTENSRDFPFTSNMHNKDVTTEIVELVAYLDHIGINSIFFDAINHCDAMYTSKYYPISESLRTFHKLSMNVDPLKVITQEAEKYDMDVYAIINPYYVGKSKDVNFELMQSPINVENTIKNDDDIYLVPNNIVRRHITNIALELVKKYPISGIVLKGMDVKLLTGTENFTQNIHAQFDEIKNEFVKEGIDKTIGFSFESDYKNLQTISSLAKSLSERLSIDLIMPKISNSTENGYNDVLTTWHNLSEKYGVSLVTINNGQKLFSIPSDGNIIDDRFEINYQAIDNEKIGATGVAIDSLTALLNKFTGLSYSISSLFSDNIKPSDMNFDPYKKLMLDIPGNGKIYTSKNSVYITGTSDPDLPILVNDVVYTNRTKNGALGINLPCDGFQTDYEITQGKTTFHISILKSEPPIKKPLRSFEINKATAYPQISSFAVVGTPVILNCQAPSGSTITATVDGVSVKLSQISQNVTRGLPALFEGTFTPPIKYSAETVVDIGKVSYAMTYNNKINFCKSNGNIFIAGKNSNKAVQIDDYFTSVYPDKNLNSIATSVAKIGAKEYIVEDEGLFYKLKSGGYIKKTSAKIITGTNKIENSYTAYTNRIDDNGETFTIIGTNAPYITSNMTDNSVIFTFYNTTSIPEIIPIETKLFKNIMKIKISENTYQLHFIFKDGIVPWGYDYKYVGNDYKDTEISFKYTPKIANDAAKPLSNISILLDPGHGGNDIGTQGVGGIFGATEASINLAVAQKAKELLESLGATVQLTRYEDQTVALFDRMRVNTQMQPHFFISIHHDGIEKYENGNEISGVKVVYQYEHFEHIANKLSENVSSATNRNNLQTQKSQNVLIENTACPTLILQCGYMSNPNEYNEILNANNIYRTACGIVNTVLETINL